MSGGLDARYDAVVVGAGPNGLVAAAVLAGSGRRVLVVEAAARPGGALQSAELTLPGFVHDLGATVLPLALASPALRSLDLERYGVTWAHPPVPVAHPLDHGAAFVERDETATASGLGVDGGAWSRLIGATARAGLPLSDALLSPLSPAVAVRALPQLARYGATAALPAAALARAFRTEGARAVFAGLAGHAVLPLTHPSTAGYAVYMGALAHLVGWPVARGGSGTLAAALARIVAERGGEIEVNSTVSNLDEVPRTPITMLDLTPSQVIAVAGDRLPDRYLRRLSRFRYGPAVFKVDWALDSPVPWRDERVSRSATVHLGGTFGQIAAAEADVARGRHPARPYVICVQPCVADPTRAPAGKHTLWAYCHVPNSSTLDQTAAIEAQLERFAPGFRDRVLARHSMDSAVLAAFDANLVGGDIGGGSAELRQFVARPVWSLDPWGSPGAGVYMCSASTPPGGGVHGMGGWHAAHRALRRHD